MSYLKTIKLSTVAVTFSAVPFSSNVAAEVQQVELVGDSSEVSAIYRTSGGGFSAGIGIRIHFDSSQVTVTDVKDLYRESLVGFQVQNDVNDYDDDASTDSFVSAAWADMNVAWPSDPSVPVKLLVLELDSAVVGSQMNVTKTSKDSRYDFSGTGLLLN